MNPRRDDPRGAYASRLRLWRLQCGEPSFRDLERLTGIPRSTLHDRLADGHGLDWEFIEKVVTAIHRLAKQPGLELDLDDWRRQYEQVSRVREQGERTPVWIGPIVAPADPYQPRRTGAALDVSGDTGRTYVLHGTGGVGKTQLAAHVADQVWRERAADLVVWVTATSRDAIVTAYAEVAEALRVDPGAGPVRVLAKLAEPGGPRWLIVLDDLQHPADADRLWPPAGNGNVLVTTRRQDASLRANRRIVVPVDLFDATESQRFLTERLGAGAAAGAGPVAAALGHLPLALELAAAYMIDLHLDCGRFLDRLAARRLQELDPDDRSRPGLTTLWTMSVRTADQLQPSGVAEPLLDVAAVLDANGIPVDLLTSAPVRALVAERRGRETTADDALDGLSCLERLSLAGLDEPRRTVRVHQLLQRAVRESAPARCSVAVRAAADAIVAIWPEDEHDRSLIQRLRDNVGAARRAGEDALWDGDMHQALFRAGNSLSRDRLFTTAIGYWTGLRTEAERRLGPEHRDTLSIRNNLAWSHGRAGDPARAAADLLELLGTRQRVLGRDAVNTLATSHGVAVWLSAAGETAKAVPVLAGLVDDYLRVLGPDHQDTLNTRLVLVGLTGRTAPADAVRGLNALLDDYLRTFGPDHERTWEVQTSLIDRLAATGAGDQALDRYTRLLASQNRVLGSDHLDTLESRYGLADLVGRLGQRGEAAALMHELLQDVTRLDGIIPYGLERLRLDIERWSAY
ncbi:tetratricopeptide repeat protein [Actinoplanes sp. NPDC051494]|uniref:tetratricopeptide repeat protein n=1 Tax=Actinoplanes sp. NPDC051494 TaxID=3363907 RepID=UPI0037A43750